MGGTTMTAKHIGIIIWVVIAAAFIFCFGILA